jgi:2-oxoglutarate ferredoxin oxidoreductase subunit alpha
MTKSLLKGNVAIAEAATRAGCEAYFGYPITPQTELLEHMASRLPELNRTFLQAESEVAAINMVYGAACAGVRVMSSTSGPGISLMQEGLSYIACSEVPTVLVNIMRGGPGLGNIQPSQSDYNLMTKSAGHGDFHSIVLAPESVQEAVDLTVLAFDLADEYRTIAMIAGDGIIGQMMEPAELPQMRDLDKKRPDWALTGAKDRDKNIITSVHLGGEALGAVNRKLQEKINRIRKQEVRYEEFMTDDADILVVAFGTAARIVKTAVREARQAGIRAGLLRPITLFPFPFVLLETLAKQAQVALVVEMNAGQMVDDVRLGVGGRIPVDFLGHAGGIIPLPGEVLERLERLAHQFSPFDAEDEWDELTGVSYAT